MFGVNRQSNIKINGVAVKWSQSKETAGYFPDFPSCLPGATPHSDGAKEWVTITIKVETRVIEVSG